MGESDAGIGSESGGTDRAQSMYSFNPSPVDPSVPEVFRKPRPRLEPPSEAEGETAGEVVDPAGDREMSPSIFSDEEQPDVTALGLGDALSYAMRHARDLQNAKEDLYLAALGLTLEVDDHAVAGDPVPTRG